MKKLFVLLALIFNQLTLFSQLQIDTSKTALQLAQLLAGNGVQVLNASCSGSVFKQSISAFINGQTTNLGLTSGVVISSGRTIDIPQQATSLSAFNSSLLGGDSLLSIIGGGTTFNTGYLEFDFIPSGDTVELQFIFASEEYPEYVCSQFSDALGIFISGEYPVGTFFTNKNIALVPGTNLPVNINTINQGLPGSYGNSANCVSLNFSSLYVDNVNGTSIVFDGFTVPIKVKTAVIPGKTYHIRLAIADILDGSYDSGVFFDAHSLISSSSNTTNALCENSQAICFANSDTIILNTNITAETGPNYGCLYTQPNPMWFNIHVSQPGNLIFNMASPTNNDIDFVCWGPFNDAYTPCTALLTANCTSCPSNTSNSTFYPSGNMVDCSYSPSSSETLHIYNAAIGDYYIIMVTNYSNQNGYMVISQSNAGQPGAGSVSCLPLSQCNIDTVTLTVGNCNAQNRYEISGNINVTNAPTMGAILITDISSNTDYILPVSGNNSIPFSIYVPFSSGNAELKFEFTEGTCTKNVSYVRPKIPTITSNVNNSSCGQSNGYVIIGITANGIPNYSYHWSTGYQVNNTSSTTSFLNNLSVGHYDVSVYNANQCYSIFEYNISNIGAPNVVIQQTDTNMCANHCNASLMATSTSSNLPLTYHWSNGAQFIDSTGAGSIDSLLCNGTYYITVTDANNCASVAQYSIYSQSNMMVNVQNVHFPNCLSQNNGFIQIQAAGGLAPYGYIWSTQPPQTGNTIINLSEGTYHYSVTDAIGCQVTDSVVLYFTNVLSVDAIVHEQVCGFDGSIELQVNGGVAPYTYIWQGYSSNHTNILNGLNVGTYYYTVVDANGCEITQHVTLYHQVNPITVNLLSVLDYCEGLPGGMAIINVSGGMPPYYDGYHYFNSIDTIINLITGVHTITIIDSNQCSTNVQVQITEKPKPHLMGNINNSNCDMSDGGIILQVLNGIAPYNYFWSNGLVLTNSYNEEIMNSNLPAGVYSVTVTHGNGCSADTFFVVNNQTALNLVVDSIIPPSCVGFTDACVTVHAINGIPPYSFIWSNGCNSYDCCGIASGTYFVTINDASNCNQIASVTIPQGQQPLAVFSFTQQSNTVSFINQSTPGSYLWMFGDGAISTEVNPIHIYSNDGQYLACLTLYSCDTVVSCHTIVITGVGAEASAIKPLVLFPNPTNDYFIVKWDASNSFNLQVFNAMMQKVIEKNIYSEEKVLVENLPTGIYFLRLIYGDKQVFQKLIIER